MESKRSSAGFASVWVERNELLLILRMLDESAQTGDNVLHTLRRRYEPRLEDEHFLKLVETLLSEGYVRFERAGGIKQLVITSAGYRLLRRLEEEHRKIAATLDQLESRSPLSGTDLV